MRKNHKREFHKLQQKRRKQLMRMAQKNQRKESECMRAKNAAITLRAELTMYT